VDPDVDYTVKKLETLKNNNFLLSVTIALFLIGKINMSSNRRRKSRRTKLVLKSMFAWKISTELLPLQFKRKR